MKTFYELAKMLSGQPPETLLVLVALGALALAAFAIHAVTSIANRRDRP
jgi:hypothetical protein